MAIFNSVYKAVDYTHFATQWPCPDYFHVPTKDEFTSVHSILTSTFNLANSWGTFRNYLKMPWTWWKYPNIQNYTNNDYGDYWTATPDWSDNAYRFGFSASYTNAGVSSYGRSYWYSIRPFRNSPIVPDSSRTTLYDWSWKAQGAGIFWNSTLWLISISWDWTNRITISDKDIWATNVLDKWNRYQWGNNYWFSNGWSVSSSSWQVDVTGYWPWNYYSSSTWITATPRQNGTSNGNNLWWWEDGNVPV